MGKTLNYRGLDIPFVSFGNVTSDDLFCDKEQELFDFYAHNRSRYRKALDIGANIGVHSILMARQGWEVRAFEPDPAHYRILLENAGRNGAAIDAECVAVSDYAGKAEFTRVLGNTTGSHLAGLKNPYGPLEIFAVDVVDAGPLLAWADFAKVDAEGAEAAIIGKLGSRCDILVEVGSRESAVMIWQHLKQIGRRAWSQQSGWREVLTVFDMPVHHSEGALFIGEEP